MSIKVKGFDDGVFMENTYVVSDPGSGLVAVVDPGAYTDRIRDAVKEGGKLSLILLTHGHADHIFALPEFRRDHPEAKVIAYSGEREMLTNASLNNSEEFTGRKLEQEADIYVEDGDQMNFGTETLTFIHTPGHTPGGMCVYTGKILFSGDTLFYRSVGRTDLPESSTVQLVRGIREKLYTLPDDTVVYPGHGPVTTIGEEKRENFFV